MAVTISRVDAKEGLKGAANGLELDIQVQKLQHPGAFYLCISSSLMFSLFSQL